MSVNKILHGGKEILYIDHQNCKEEEMIENLKEAQRIILSDNRPHIQLINGTQSFATPNFMKAANEFGRNTKDLTEKGAYVGLSGAKKVLFQAYNVMSGSKMKAFETLEDAKEYLVSN